MKKIFEFRYYQIVAVIIVLMATLAIRLFVLTVIENDMWEGYALSYNQKSISTSAPRGEILDRYGRLLAGNAQMFSVNFDATNLTDKEINKTAIEVIRILEANKDTYNDEFPILIKNGKYTYTYQEKIEEWLVSEGIPTYYTAEQTFNALRDRLGIDESLTKYEAQSEMQNLYKVYPPISVKKMEYTEDLYKNTFLGKFELDLDLTAEETFNALRKECEIDSAYTVEDARKILIVRNEIMDLGYSKYMTATIATGISNQSIVILKENSANLPGIEIASETMRYYPYQNTASHVIGYLGKISEGSKEKYVKKLGYNPSDLIGQSGIESAYEQTLRGKDGVKVVQVNASGEKVKVIGETEPQKGKDVYLTLDLELQKTADAALKQALTQIQRGGTFVSKYGNYNYSKSFRNANVGAAVAIEVETGDVLAMSSYPNFDPNLFANGISTVDWQALQSTNPRDSLAPAPLYNVATRTPVSPGSTFKMVTATAALAKGLNPTRKLYDGGYIMVGNRPWNCLIYTSSHRTHGAVDLPHALEVSCNYYFYDIATGKDYHANKSLGYDLDIDTIMTYAKQYGLGLPTGIEITETITSVPSATKKMASTKAALKSAIYAKANKFFEPKVYSDKELLAKYINEIVSWTEENPTRNELLERMPKYGIKENMVASITDLCKYDYFNQANLTLGDEFNIAIGQGDNAYTPLQMANYVATIGNGGMHNSVSIIKAIEGQGRVEKAEPTKVDITDENLGYIVDGMKLVANGSKGSLRSIFGKFPVTVAAKSGTAEKNGVVQPVDEVEYVKSHLRQLTSKITWAQVEAEMNRLMTEQADSYPSSNSAVDQAVINLSDGGVTQGRINAWKPSYDNYAWIVGMAPADDPKIAVAALVFQGGTASYAAPIVREIIGKYLEMDKEYKDLNLETTME